MEIKTNSRGGVTMTLAPQMAADLIKWMGTANTIRLEACGIRGGRVKRFKEFYRELDNAVSGAASDSEPEKVRTSR